MNVVPAQRSYTMVGDVRIAFTDAPGAGPPLLFIHGWCSNLDHWASQAVHFHGRRRVICVDRRGHGQSGAPNSGYDPETVATDIATLARKAGAEPLVCIAHAGGAASAFALACHYPHLVDTLIIVEGRLHLPLLEMRASGDPMAAFLDHVHQALEDDFSGQLPTIYQGFFANAAPNALVDFAIADALATPRHAALADMLYGIGAGTLPFARQVIQPVHWIYSRDSAIGSIAHVTDTFSNVTFHEIKGFSHFPQMEASGVLNRILDSVVSKPGQLTG